MIRNGVATIEWAGEKLELLPERALWWSREKTLFITDPHFGKTSAFRFAGIPAPELADHDDLGRLESMVKRHGVERLIILGDFFHAKTGRSKATLSALTEWRERHAKLDIVLVLGNHDRHAGKPPKEWRIQCVKSPWPLAPFLCAHSPETKQDGFVLAGHWHPSFRFNDSIGSGVHAPCFYFSGKVAVLPAYGSFTGRHPVKPKGNDRIFLIGPDEV
ncbi:MAG: ligase-associated DNA damage response endonuclease PdeM, partial [Verrucomicrobiota bacterium]